MTPERRAEIAREVKQILDAAKDAGWQKFKENHGVEEWQEELVRHAWDVAFTAGCHAAADLSDRRNTL